jgi:molybdate transport system substrate-binding protein
VKRFAWILAIATALALPADGHAAEIKVLSGTGPRAAVRELVAQFERASGHTVAIQFHVNAEVKRRIDGGETFDATVLNPEVLDALIREGKVAVASRASIGRSGVGVAVRAGAAKPDIASVEGFRKALLAAKSVAFPGEGASGRYFVSLLGRLGIADEMKPKLRPMPASDAVEIVARGEAEMVVVVMPRMSGVPGIEVVGPLPAELQTWIGFAAGVSTGAKEPEAAQALVRFLASSEAAPVLRAKGIEPN